MGGGGRLWQTPAEIQVCDVHGLLMKPATVRKVGYQLNKEINDAAGLVLGSKPVITLAGFILFTRFI